MSLSLFVTHHQAHLLSTPRHAPLHLHGTCPCMVRLHLFYPPNTSFRLTTFPTRYAPRTPTCSLVSLIVLQNLHRIMAMGICLTSRVPMLSVPHSLRSLLKFPNAKPRTHHSPLLRVSKGILPSAWRLLSIPISLTLLPIKSKIFPLPSNYPILLGQNFSTQL